MTSLAHGQRSLPGCRRVVDLGVSVPGSLITLPLIVCLLVAIRIDSPGPGLLRQERIGLGGYSFEMFKLRSMIREAKDSPSKMRSDCRVTRLGMRLRRGSLDELPQLWNVVRGEMTLVGPRPELRCMLAQYRSDHYRRFNVLPGLTGLWQVSGRSNLSLEEKLALDLHYVDHRSLRMDLAILARTPKAVATGRGAY